MDLDAFWKLIEASRQESEGELEVQVDLLRDKINKLDKDEIISFQKHFDQVMADAYHWDLWAAAYIVNTGCSDDGFADFRAGLIARGREAFENALRQPESLADLQPPLTQCEEMLYVAQEAYEDATGTEMPPWKTPPPSPPEPKGEPWDEEDVDFFNKKFPKLWGKFWKA
jgi:hypothetical protein